MGLDHITPATAALDASPSDALAAAFPKHALMVDPDNGAWIKGSWFSSEVRPSPARCTASDCPEHGRRADAGSSAVDVVVAHLLMDQVPAVHPEDLPAYLPTRRQMLDDVFRYPLRDVVGAIGATRSAEPGVLLRALAVTAP